MKLLSENAKTVKSEKLGWKNMILQLMPHTNNSLGKNLCPMANGCENTCLVYTGRGMFPVVMNARRTRTEFFIKDKVGFVEQLMVEIDQLSKKHPKLCIRLNGFSDIQWENINIDGKNIFEHIPEVQFY